MANTFETSEQHVNPSLTPLISPEILDFNTSLQCGQNVYTEYELSQTSQVILKNFVNHDQNYDVYSGNQQIILDSEQYSDAYLSEIFKHKNKPKALFIDSLLELTNNSITELETVKNDLYEMVRKNDDFPYKEGYLKKRLLPRTKGGQSVENKLANDCYVLLRARDGDYLEDLSQVVGVSKRTKLNESASQNLSPNPDNIHYSLSLKETIVKLSRNFHEFQIKQDNVISSLKQEISVLKTENDQTKIRVKEEGKDLKTVRKKYDNLIDEISSLKNSITIVKQNCDEQAVKIENIDQEIESIDSVVKGCLTKLSDEHKDVTKLDIAHNKLSKDVSNIKVNINEFSEMANDCAIITKRYDDEKLNGIASVRSGMKCINDEIKRIDDAIVSNTTKFTSAMKSVNTLSTQFTSIQAQLSNVTKSYAHVVKNGEHNKTDTEPIINTNKTASLPSTDSRTQSLNVDQIINPNTSENERRIHVHFPTSQCNATRPLHNFNRVSNNRVCRLYVWNINKYTSTETDMRKFLIDRNIHVTFLRYFDRNQKRTASAQVNIKTEKIDVLLKSNFWPAGIKVREWLPHESFIREKRGNN